MNDVDAHVYDALMRRVKSLSTTPSVQVAYPLLEFTPSAYPYFKVSDIPVDGNAIALEGFRHIKGILQIGIMLEREKGLSVSKSLAGQIAAHFPHGLVLWHEGQRVEIHKPTVSKPPIFDGHELMVPVHIHYQSFA